MNIKIYPVSVLLPTYNSTAYVEKTLCSLLNQTYQRYELLILDDCSTDNTIEILSSFFRNNRDFCEQTQDKVQCYFSKSESIKIKIFRNVKNLGIYQTMNKLVDIAVGNYVIIANHDDISYPFRIEKQVEFLEQHKDYVIVGSQLDLINENGDVIGKRSYPINHEQIVNSIFFKSPFAHPAVTIRTDVLKQFMYNSYYTVASEYDLWFKLLDNYKGHNLSDVLIGYRVHSNQESQKNYLSLIMETSEIQNKYVKLKKYNKKSNVLLTFLYSMGVRLLPAKLSQQIYRIGIYLGII